MLYDPPTLTQDTFRQRDERSKAGNKTMLQLIFIQQKTPH